MLLMQKKCEMYWPENVDSPVEYGDITVTLVEVERFGDYIQRTMKIRYSVSSANIITIDRYLLSSCYYTDEGFLTCDVYAPTDTESKVSFLFSLDIMSQAFSCTG